MGPFEDTGPYAETIISTRRADFAQTDKATGICNLLLGLIVWIITLPVLTFMVLYIWYHIGIILAIGPIVLGFWACARYGTKRSMFHRFKRLSARDRMRTDLRLWDVARQDKN